MATVQLLSEVEDAVHSLMLDIAQITGQDIQKISRTFNEDWQVRDLSQLKAAQLVAALHAMGYEAEIVEEEGGE